MYLFDEYYLFGLSLAGTKLERGKRQESMFVAGN